MNSRTRNRVSCIALLALAVAAPLAQAQSTNQGSADEQVITSEAFLSSHPDLRYRLLGWRAYEKQDFDKAMEHFQRAARFADKPSQGMVAEMLWHGQGTAPNRPLAMAWMDLAAERKFKLMLANRDRYWSSLSDAERLAAIDLAAPLYAEYGDDVAQPRLERLLRTARRNSTGSRTGFVGNMRITIPGPDGSEVTVDGSQFYQEKFWKPEAYWAWQADVWKELPQGRVEVGEMRESKDEAGKKK